MANTANNEIPFVPENTLDPAAGLNIALNAIDAQLDIVVQSMGDNTPPAGVEGERHIVGTSPTGAWSGQANKMARYYNSIWEFYTVNFVIYNGGGFTWNSSAWIATDATGLLGQANVWTASQVASTQVATLNGSQTLDMSTYDNFIITLNGDITLANPTTETVGQSGFICFKQDATGSRLLTLGTEWLTSGTDPVLSTTANAIDVLGYVVVGSGQILLGAALLDYN